MDALMNTILEIVADSQDAMIPGAGDSIRRRIEAESDYFKEYDTRHEAMKLLSDAWWRTKDQRIRGIISRANAYIRDTALDLIPYGATTPNKDSYGRYHGKRV